jgi:quercetin dioxygenase-like cupin family protein
MNNKEYAETVNAGNYPSSIAVPLDPSFIDDRGAITNLWLGQSGSLTFITSKEGSVRAKHKHTNDWHATYIIAGDIKYIEGELENKKEHLFKEGDMFFTKPDIYHEMHFLTDCKMITVNNIVKNHENYENDVKR